MRKWIFFAFMAFVFALIHACSLQNGIVKPTCQVFQFDMADKWWTPATGNTSDNIYFTSAGVVKEGTSTDSITYTLQSCNSLVMFDNTTGKTTDWMIQSLTPNKMVVALDSKNTVTYTSSN